VGQAVIAGICHVKDEIDIVELVVRHTLAEGLDRLFFTDHMSTDGTWELLQEMALTMPIDLGRNEDPVFHQAAQMNMLAEIAMGAGADWIVPFDADEFFYANNETVAEALNRMPAECLKLYCHSWRYLDFNRRDPVHQRAKVIFRALPGACLVAGNHDVTLLGGVWDIVNVAHLQYRSREQFIAKINGLTAYEPLFAVQGRPALLGKSDEELSAEYDALCAVETVVAPIPIRVEAR
jgi:Glycosyl transferase family 2